LLRSVIAGTISCLSRARRVPILLRIDIAGVIGWPRLISDSRLPERDTDNCAEWPVIQTINVASTRAQKTTRRSRDSDRSTSDTSS
jgi:hypothetical protein